MDTPALAWEGPLSIQEVAQQLIKALFVSHMDQLPSEEALRAEVLRVAIWEQSVLSQSQSLTEARVSTQKILRRARFLWQPIAFARTKKNSSEGVLFEEDLSRQTLESLAEQGDVLSLAGGQWLPTPLRLVPISQDRCLLVGGVPTSLLAREISRKLHLHGSFRQIDVGFTRSYPPFDGVAESWQFQTRENWLGAPPQSFRELLDQFREIALLPQTTQHAADVYVASRDKPQRQRWQPLERVQTSGRYLLRSQRPWGQRFYTIGYIENCQIQMQSQLLESWDIRRLCYALDDDARMPTRVTWNKREETLTLESELPARERKRLATLGSLQTNGTNFYYPRIWRIAPHNEQDVQHILRELAVIIQ